MLNGFGAADSYYPIKELPGLQCRRCKKADMALMELRMKIRIVYIPTFTIGKKYAVCCPKCKEGFYVDDAQRTFILNHDASCVQVSDEGITLVDDEADAVEAAPQAASLPEPEEAPVAAPPAEPAAAKEEAAPKCSCGAELIPGALFCMKCGKKVNQASPAPAPVQPVEAPVVQQAAPVQPVQAEASSFVYKKPKVCPECGMHVTGQKDTCSICGAKIS